MTVDLLVTLAAAFMAVALLAGWGTAAVLSARSPERRRLHQFASAGGADLDMGPVSLIDSVDPRFRRIPGILPKSAKDMNRLRRRLANAGYNSLMAPVVYGFATILVPVGIAFTSWLLLGSSRFMLVLMLTALGALLPGVFLSRKIEQRKLQIQNGLPDALDLLIVCVEAGCALDQAIMKASEELEISYPALTDELKMINTEMRAGKPRLEAFKNFAARTKVEDVQSLVALLVQTDKFGTSIAQALRTHAETSRTKRRQRAEERAAKIGVKLVFPLVLFLFPALYVVILGPAVIQYFNVFKNTVGR
jgi:tight adherence protein C